MNKPNLFIVGQHKSGTTALHYFLDQHPDIYMSKEKEPNYFCKDFHKESDFYLECKRYFRFREEQDYLRLFSNSKEAKVVGESSGLYLYSRIAAEEIYKFNPAAKIIIMHRNPVDFIYSLHSHLFNITYENVEDFKTALSLEKERHQGKCIPPREYLPSRLYYSERIKYFEQVKRYYDLFDKSNIKVIIFDDFKENNHKAYKDALKFLGVNDGFVPDFKMVNISKKPRNKIMNFLAQNPLLLRMIKVLLPQRYHSIIREIGEKVLLKKEPRLPMDPLLREELMRKYRPEVIKISKFLGIDLEKRWH